MIPKNETNSNWDKIMVVVFCSELVEYIFDKTSIIQKIWIRWKGSRWSEKTHKLLHIL